MRTPLFGCLIGLCMLVLLAQCQKSQPQAPKAEGFDPPIPAQLSYLAGSITFDLRELEEKINRELDPVLIGKETKDGKTRGIISFRVKRMGPVHVEYADQQVKLSAPLQMWLTKPFSHDTTPPKKPFCALNVHFKTPISVTSNWRLDSQTNFTDYTWIVQPEVAGISLTKLVQHMLDKHKTNIERAIDAAVRKELRLDEMVKPIWRDLQKPLLITEAYGLWLTPKPIQVMAGPVTGNDRQITTHIRIALETQTELKPSKPEHPKTPLPMLQKQERVDETSDLHLLSYIPYADLNRMLAITTNNRNKKLALGSLTINEVSVYGGQKSLVVKANLSGLLDGTVYLRGRPVFDTLTNTLRVSNLDFDSETSKALSQESNTLWHNGLRRLLERLLTIRLGNDIARLPTLIDKAFEKGPGKTTDLGIKTFRFVPQKIAIRPDGIQVQINVQSTVGVKVNQL